MNLTERLLSVALHGAEWVLWVLIALSVISVAVMIERIIFFRTTSLPFEGFQRDLRTLLGKREVQAARGLVQRHAGAIESDVVAAGLANFESGAAAAGEAMVGAKSRAKLRLSRNLAFLGTLGNNAPFVGLFGTVIGVIKAFHDLKMQHNQGPDVVMGSLSEALIATAVGLLVAIPAVVAFNYFNGQMRQRLANTDALAHDVLTELNRDGAAATAAAGK